MPEFRSWRARIASRFLRCFQSIQLSRRKSILGKRKERPTELENPASRSLDALSTRAILQLLSREDHRVAPAVSGQIPKIARAVEIIVEALEEGGRLVYVGAGTSGRLGVVDAAECIPTFGTTRVIALMAGAPKAMFQPSEGLEDDPRLARRDLQKQKINRKDVVVGISAGGDTTYTLAALREAGKRGARTIAVSSNPRGEICRIAEVAIVPRVGPEAIAGSTRMKAGTSQKLVLNMLSTASMVRWGRVLGNRMVHMKLGSRKLIERARAILMRTTGASAQRATRALDASGRNLPVALVMLARKVSREQAQALLAGESQHDVLERILGRDIARRSNPRRAARGATRKNRKKAVGE